MNNDLIRRSALFEKIQPVDFLYGHDEDAPYSGMAVDACDVDAALSVDAVEIVRCEKCVFKQAFDGFGDLLCGILKVPMNNNDFCSYGERMVYNA